jgi:hypothetical protein
MNRRSFFTKLGLAAASLAVLPAATTYARKWVAPGLGRVLWVPNPEWVNAPFEIQWSGHDGLIKVDPPLRFKHDGGNMVMIPPMIQSKEFHREFLCEPFKS